VKSSMRDWLPQHTWMESLCGLRGWRAGGGGGRRRRQGPTGCGWLREMRQLKWKQFLLSPPNFCTSLPSPPFLSPSLLVSPEESAKVRASENGRKRERERERDESPLRHGQVGRTDRREKGLNVLRMNQRCPLFIPFSAF